MGIFYKEGDINADGATEVCLKTSAGTELLGQKDTTNSIPVTIASDQLPIPVHLVGSGQLFVNSDGSINVVPIGITPTPDNAIKVAVVNFGNVSSTAGVHSYYTITNGKSLTIQTLVAGSEASNGGAVVELFYDPNATLTAMTRVSTLFINGTSDNTPVNQTFIGNGTRRIVLCRRGYTNSAREMFAHWLGYEI